jgi:hypothetical protein
MWQEIATPFSADFLAAERDFLAAEKAPAARHPRCSLRMISAVSLRRVPR